MPLLHQHIVELQLSHFVGDVINAQLDIEKQLFASSRNVEFGQRRESSQNEEAYSSFRRPYFADPHPTRRHSSYRHFRMCWRGCDGIRRPSPRDGSVDLFGET